MPKYFLTFQTGKIMEKMEYYLLFTLFTCLDCFSANNQCGLSSMGGMALNYLRFQDMILSALHICYVMCELNHLSELTSTKTKLWKTEDINHCWFPWVPQAIQDHCISAAFTFVAFLRVIVPWNILFTLFTI